MDLTRYAALLFDCDGTIADSMPLHHRAWQLALAPESAHFPEALFYEWAGRPSEAIAEGLNQKFGYNLKPSQMSDEKEKHYLAIMLQVKPVPEIIKIIESHRDRMPMAVVSGSPRASVLKTLNHLGLTAHFQAVLGAEDYGRGKPAPDCFLEAAKLLKVEPAKCLVFEDAEFGIQAAQAAKMDWAKIDPRKGLNWGPAKV